MPCHIELRRDGLKGGGNAIHRDGKPVQIPFDTHEKHIFGGIDMLVQVQDIAVIAGEKFGDSGDQPFTIRAGNKQCCRLRFWSF